MKKIFILGPVLIPVVFLLSSCMYYVDEAHQGSAYNNGYNQDYSAQNVMANSEFLTLVVYDNRYIYYDNNNSEVAVWIFQADNTVIKRGRVINGLVKVFYGANMPAAEIMYKNNERDGYSRFYNRNGKPMEFGNYTNGQRNGDWKRFSDEGTLNEEFVYSGGNISYKLRPQSPVEKVYPAEFDYLNREHEFKKEVKQDFDKKDIYPKQYSRVFGAPPAGNINNDKRTAEVNKNKPADSIKETRQGQNVRAQLTAIPKKTAVNTPAVIKNIPDVKKNRKAENKVKTERVTAQRKVKTVETPTMAVNNTPDNKAEKNSGEAAKGGHAGRENGRDNNPGNNERKTQ